MSTFFDTNILVYAQQNERRSPAARKLLEDGGTISVQVLNEFTNVLARKFARSWTEIEEAVSDVIDTVDLVLPLTADTHAAGLRIARDHRIAFYDALIVASALEAECRTLYSEDLHHGMRFGRLKIANPFL